MKKKLLVGFLLFIVLLLGSCTTKKPEDTVDIFFKSAKNFDFKTMASLILPSNLEDVNEVSEMGSDEDNEYEKFFFDYLKNTAEKLSYSITESEINGDKAVVTVDTKYIDSGLLLKTTIGESMKEMIGLAFSGVELSEEELEQILSRVMKEQMDLIEETYIESSIKIKLVKSDNTWYIEELNDQLFDVVLSGFVSAGAEIEESFVNEENNQDEIIEEKIEDDFVKEPDSEMEPDDVEVKEDPKVILREINNYVISDLWNDGFIQVSWYLETGKGSYGQDLDIDFTKSQLEKAMNKKTAYDEFIHILGSDYKEVKEVWNKLSSEADSLYEQIKSETEVLNTDIFVQYREAFTDLVNDDTLGMVPATVEVEGNPKDILTEINNYVISDLWNDGFIQFSWYLETGKGSYGQEIDIDFTKSQLEKAMSKKADYDEFIQSLDSNYDDLKEVWNKLSIEADSLFDQIQSEVETLNTDFFEQYRNAFTALIYDL